MAMRNSPARPSAAPCDARYRLPKCAVCPLSRMKAATQPLPLPHTGSSSMPQAGAKERTSIRAGAPGACSPKMVTPVSWGFCSIRFMRAMSGWQASTAAALSSWATIQRAPTSISRGRASRDTAQPRMASSSSTSASSSGVNAGCGRSKVIQRSPSLSWLTSSCTNPAAHSCTSRPSRGAIAPASSSAWAVPMVGWPANGSSEAGVKMRTR
ncbi:hypothetical protein D3C80_1449510 [compost metagenome]